MEEYRNYMRQNKKQHMAGTLFLVVILMTVFIVGSSVSFIEKKLGYDVLVISGNNF